jgi:hypothetical protein
VWWMLFTGRLWVLRTDGSGLSVDPSVHTASLDGRLRRCSD